MITHFKTFLDTVGSLPDSTNSRVGNVYVDTSNEEMHPNSLQVLLDKKEWYNDELLKKLSMKYDRRVKMFKDKYPWYSLNVELSDFNQYSSSNYMEKYLSHLDEFKIRTEVVVYIQRGLKYIHTKNINHNSTISLKKVLKTKK